MMAVLDTPSWKVTVETPTNNATMGSQISMSARDSRNITLILGDHILLEADEKAMWQSYQPVLIVIVL